MPFFSELPDLAAAIEQLGQVHAEALRGHSIASETFPGELSDERYESLKAAMLEACGEFLSICVKRVSEAPSGMKQETPGPELIRHAAQDEERPAVYANGEVLEFLSREGETQHFVLRGEDPITSPRISLEETGNRQTILLSLRDIDDVETILRGDRYDIFATCPARATRLVIEWRAAGPSYDTFVTRQVEVEFLPTTLKETLAAGMALVRVAEKNWASTESTFHWNDAFLAEDDVVGRLARARYLFMSHMGGVPQYRAFERQHDDYEG